MPCFFGSLFLHVHLCVVLIIALTLTVAYVDIYFCYDPSAAHFGQLVSPAISEILRNVRHHETLIISSGLFLYLHTRYLVGFDTKLSVCCFQIPRRLIIKDVIGCFSWLFIMITSFASSTEVWTFSAQDGIIIRLLLSVIADLSSLESWYRAFQYPNENGNVNFATKMGMLPPLPISRKLTEKCVRVMNELRCPVEHELESDAFDVDISLELGKLSLSTELPKPRHCHGPFGANLESETSCTSRYSTTSSTRNKDGPLLSPAAFVYTAPGVKH